MVRAIASFAVGRIAEIGDCWLIRQSVRKHRPWWSAAGAPLAPTAYGFVAPTAYGFVAPAQTDSSFGRILAA